MKKLNYILLGAAALAMASCSQEEVAAPSAEGIPFTIKLPADQGTRALSDGLTADDLWIAIYDQSTGNNLVDQVKAEFGNSLETTVYLNLANGKTYNIAFFACSPAAANDGVYNFNAGDKMLYVNYGNMKSASNLADAYDCFYQLHNTGKISTENATPVTVTLYRPVAQINWGTSDYDEAAIKDDNAFGPNGQYVLTNLTLDAYTQFDLFTKDVSGKATQQTISAFAAPVTEAFPVYEPKDILNSEGEVIGEENLYQYVAMQYVLAPKDGGLFDLSLDINNGGNPNIGATVVTNDVVSVNSAPLQANYRTNIYGALLTNPFEYKVVKDPNWEKPDYNIGILPNYSLNAAELNGARITESGNYMLSGTVSGTYKITVDTGLDVVIDGSGLTVDENDTFGLYFSSDGLADAISQVLNPVERTGSYTYQNISGGVLSIKTGNTTVNVKNNNLTYLDLGASNITLNITGNTIDSDNVTHTRWDNGQSKNCAYLYMIDYDLTFNNNTLTNANAGPFQINGWGLNDGPDWTIDELRNLNNIKSFQGNSFTVTEYEATEADWTAAITFLGDGTYYWISGNDFSEGANNFMNMVEAGNNTFAIASPAIGAYKFKFSDLVKTGSNSIRVDSYK